MVVAAGASAPAGWADSPRVTIDAATLADPRTTVELLRSAAYLGSSSVIELAVEFDDLPDSVDERHPHEVGAGHWFALDELHHLVWSNAVDARDPDVPRWALVDAAVVAGAAPSGGGEAGDVVLPDGRSAWLAGGPIGHHDPVDGVAIVHAVQLEHRRFGAAAPNVTNADLADDQLAAVTHPGGAARIIAPAGSGKTRVLTERARHLLDVWQIPAASVSLVAFNKRAQEEMLERTRDLPGLHVRTLNAIALAIVNGTPPFAPQSRNWRTLDEPDVRRILQRFVTVPRRRNTDPIAPWIEALSLVRLGLVDPAEVEVRYGGDVDGLADVFPQYRAALERDGAVDFDDQIHRAIEVLLTQPAARRAAQRACRVLLVDEFQDLTPAHLLLVRLLAAPGGAVFGVGDDDQTIYGYNGADPAWLIDFARWFPGAGDHPLEVNYRCPAGVVAAADRLLRHNARRVAKTIRAASTDSGGWSAVSSDDPVTATVDAVDGRRAQRRGHRRHRRPHPRQRHARAGAGGVDRRRRAGVGWRRHRVRRSHRGASRPRLAATRPGGAPFAADDLGEALRRPSRPLHPRIADWVGEQRDVDALLRLADRLTNERDAARVTEFADDIARLQAMLTGGTTTAGLFAALVDEIGLGGSGRHPRRQPARHEPVGPGRRPARRSRQLARQHADPATFEPWLRGHLATRRHADGVVLATVHRVKGQEWPHVVVHLADADQFPHRLADDLEEERRLFHVAFTRASAFATIVSGEHPSPFVAELSTEPPEVLPPAPTRPAAKPTGTGRRTDDHPLLDRGTVMAVVGLELVDQGQGWVITEIQPEAVVAERNGTTRRFRLGTKVETVGKQRGELAPRPGGVDEASARLFDLLRVFRDTARAGKPAYTVFDDKTLAGIAAALPSDLAALARVKGVGPAKLEQYGDDVLSLVTQALEP